MSVRFNFAWKTFCKGGIALLFLSSCAEEPVVQPRVSTGIVGEKETTSSDNPTGPLNLAESFHKACGIIGSLNLSDTVETGLVAMCKDGKATNELLSAVQIPYKGNASYTIPMKVTDDGSRTSELVATPAIQFSKGMSVIESKMDGMMDADFEAGGVTTTNTITKKIAPVDATYRDCYSIDSKVVTEIVGIPFDVLFKLNGCLIIVSAANPRIILTYRELDPTVPNKYKNLAINLLVEAGENSVVGYSYSTGTVDNMGFPSFAKPKLTAQPEAFLKSYYQLVHQ